jgi:hypothetical protein
MRFSPSLELELVQRRRRRLLASDDAAAERQPHSSNSSAFRQPDGTWLWAVVSGDPGSLTALSIGERESPSARGSSLFIERKPTAVARPFGALSFD